MLNYRHLRYFQAVAHEGNLTRAAERLNLSQSALSVQIKTLEERLGQALFDRVGRELRLTEAGRIALDHADRIFATGEELLDTLAAEGAVRRALRVGALATLSRNFTMSFLAPVLGRSDVDIVLRSGSPAELMGALSALNLDVVLLNTPAPRDEVTAFLSHRLDAQPVSLVGTPERVGPERDLATLMRAHPLLLPTRGTALRAAFDTLCDRMELRFEAAAEVDDMALLRLLARADAGLAVLPPIVVRDEIAAGTLIDIAPLPGIVESFYAVTLDRRFPNPLLRELLETGLNAPA
jgi:LysR family transcriptional activator of nhaA